MGGTTKWSRKRRRKEILLYKELHPLATLIEIGEQFGVTKQYISQFLISNNIDAVSFENNLANQEKKNNKQRTQ